MKWRQFRGIKEEADPGAPTNNTDPDGFATYATPLFVTKRFAGMKEFVVPHEMYTKMRTGRELGDRWINYVEDPALQAEIRQVYHRDEQLLLTCALTGISSIIRKHRLRSRQGMGMDDCP